MDYYSSPIPSLVDGLLQGVALGHSIQQGRQQAEQFKTQQALENQKLSMNDILNLHTMQQMGRPVTPMGTISEPGKSVSLPSPSTPAIPGNLGSDNQAATPPVPAMQLPDALNQPIQMPGYTRKADPSRTVTYQDRFGKKTQTELYTPEEQAQHALADALQKRYGGSTLVNTSPALSELGLPAQMWIPNEHLYQYAQAVGGLKPIATPPTYQQMGGPATVPAKDLPSVMNTVGTAQTRADQNTRAANQIKSQQQIAEANRKSRESIAFQAQGGQNTRTQQEIQSREKIAAETRGKNAQLTPGQEAVERRFEQRKQDTAKKEMDALQAQENKVHSSRLQLGKLMQGLDQKSLPAAQAKMAGYNQEIQDIQARKATKIGAQVPNKQQLQQIGEGETRPAPDGHLWKKQDGIVYLVK